MFAGGRRFDRLYPGTFLLRRVDSIDRLGRIAKLRVESPHRFRGIRLVLRRKIIAVSADFPPPHVRRLGVLLVASLKDLGIKSARGFQFLHVPKLRELKRRLQVWLRDLRFAYGVEDPPKIRDRFFLEVLIPHQSYVWPVAKLAEPIVHGLDNL